MSAIAPPVKRLPIPNLTIAQWNRFEAQVSREPHPKGCWLWKGKSDEDGYGRVQFGDQRFRAHRVAFRQRYGVIPAGEDVCHHCDVRACVNPLHHFSGPNAANIADMVAKGRHPRGSGNGQAKLTEEQVTAIAADPRPYDEIATEYGIGKTAVGNIKLGNKWRSVTGLTRQATSHRWLTEAEKDAIRADQRPLTTLARAYGFSPRTIGRIKQGRGRIHRPVRL